jgi:hypothetical protein
VSKLAKLLGVELSSVQVGWLASAIEDSILLGLDADFDRRVMAITFDVWTFTENGKWPDDPRIVFVLSPVGRLAASIRLGVWNDVAADVVPMKATDLPELIRSMGGCEIYGHDYFDSNDRFLEHWDGRVSVDESWGSDGRSHSLRLFQEEGNERFLEFFVWYDTLQIRNAQDQELSVDAVITAYQRLMASRGDPSSGANTKQIRRDLGPIPLATLTVKQ